MLFLAEFSTGEEFLVNAGDVVWPAWYNWWKAIVFGQRMYEPGQH